MTLTMSLTWMLFCSESRATAKRLSFLRFTAWCRTVSTFPCMFNTWETQESFTKLYFVFSIHVFLLFTLLCLWMFRSTELWTIQEVARVRHGEGYYLKRLSLQPDDDSDGLWVQLDQLTPFVLPSCIDTGCRLWAELQVSGQHLQLHAHTQTQGDTGEDILKIPCLNTNKKNLCLIFICFPRIFSNFLKFLENASLPFSSLKIYHNVVYSTY